MKQLGKIRLTIGTKLVGLIAGLLTLSVFSIVWQSTRMFTEDNTDLIRQMNADTTAILATQMRELFEGTTNRMRTLGAILIQDFPQPEMRDKVVNEFFGDKDYLAVVVHTHSEDGTATLSQKVFSPEMAAMNDPQGEKALAAALADKNFQLSQVAKGEVQLSTVKMADGNPAIVLAMPFIQTSNEHFSHSVMAFVKQSKFVKAFTEIDSVTSYMVDRFGRLLAHPDAARVAAGESVGHLEIVKELMKGQFNNNQMRYFEQSAGDGKGEWRLGAFRVVGFAGLGVIAEVPELKAFDASTRVKYRSMLISGIILAIAFFMGFVYSGTITYPIRLLVEAAHKIAKGDFNINLKAKSQDEIAALSLAFNDMAKGLEERDKVKETFNKFHNPEIAEKLLSGEVKLGGERKHATIFFSDVRGFTAMSETMEPEQVVEMLNEYMTRMVSIIRAHNGIVDKYVGDAIMAIWGVPLEKPGDTLNAVKACLAMREDLAKLNELRQSRGQGVLKIGMGLNRGPVIAGNIGSTEKMEYTVIGDSVNTASRMESMTKEYGTDFLIPKAIYEEVKDQFVFEQCKSAKVKGKTEALEVFKVKGYVDAEGKPVLITTPYSEYEAEKSDKVVHDEPKHEEKKQSEDTGAHLFVAGASERTATGLTTAPAPTPVVAAEPVAVAAQPVAVAEAPQTITPEPAIQAAPQPQGKQPSIAELIDQIPVPNPFAKEKTGATRTDLTIQPPVQAAAPVPVPAPAVESDVLAPNIVVPVITDAEMAAANAQVEAELKAAAAGEKTHPHLDRAAIAAMAAAAATEEKTDPQLERPSVASVAEEKTDPQLELPREATKTIEAPPREAPTRVTAPAASRREWYIQAEGQTFGPFTIQEVYSGIVTSELSAEMLAAPQLQAPQWLPLASWPEFSARFKAGSASKPAA